MHDYTSAELEGLFNIDQKREWIRYAHNKRMRLRDRKEREKAKLSDFLDNHEVTWCWFIHNKVGIPICNGWPPEVESTPTHYWESRRVWNDVLVSEWMPLPEVKAGTATALIDYLRQVYGRDPELALVGHSTNIVDDFTQKFQYRCVTCPPLRIPTRKETQRAFEQLIAQMGSAVA